MCLPYSVIAFGAPTQASGRNKIREGPSGDLLLLLLSANQHGTLRGKPPRDVGLADLVGSSELAPCSASEEIGQCCASSQKAANTESPFKDGSLDPCQIQAR